MGVVGEDKLTWMSEYAEFHSINENALTQVTLQVWEQLLLHNLQD
jgi:hypothetical protein